MLLFISLNHKITSNSLSKRGDTLKKKPIIWVIIFLSSFLGFQLIENIFTIRPNIISGNGNLGILIIILFSPIFIASYFLTFRLVRGKLNNAENRKMIAAILFLSLTICALLILLLSNYTNELIISLGVRLPIPNQEFTAWVGLINIQIVCFSMFTPFFSPTF